MDNDPPPRPAQQQQQQQQQGQEKARKENQPQPPVYREDVKTLAPNNPYASNNDNAGSSSGSQSQQQTYAAPPGPPPSHQQSEFAPPAGPPPGRDDWIAPPQGPPPSAGGKAAEHDWQAAVPDTSLFPPPPAIFSGYDYSPANNATEEEANAGEDWCVRYPLTAPMQLDAAGKTALQANNIRLVEPVGFSGRLNWLGTGHWEASTERNSPDRCIIGYPPLYLVNEHDPTRFGAPKTIYYEVKIHSDSRDNSIGMGFTALPYPSFRLPGWHRGSLGVHGDDGHKYINDRWGGKDFTHEFRKGETLGRRHDDEADGDIPAGRDHLLHERRSAGRVLGSARGDGRRAGPAGDGAGGFS